ncbi:phage tail protein [Burkholderia cepacia]|uniref:phage tail tip fiber protein n=1 Tax=Burkholderia cepacia TaxID=292 RepID=UPI0009BE37FA|nr:phage tail protein [Burkholderia cepacia]
MKKIYAESGPKRISGAKGGGGGGSGGGESPDSLHSVARAKVLDAISEGPIVGLVKGMQSVFLDGTPIQNSDGSVNFQNYSVDVRTGTLDQEFMPGFPAVEREAAVGVPLTSDAPWVRQVQNTQLSAARIRFGLPALQKSDPATGVFGYRVEYAIDLSVDGGSYAQVLSSAFDGKTTSLYERSHRIELPRATTGWLVRVRRITPNAHSSLIADTVNIEAITEVIDRKLRYPMTALVGMTFDARSFSQVPVRSYHIRGLIVRVPSNYDPETRAYSGAWDGTFKPAWTNNPAWIFYDLLLNDRYGLGKTVDASMIDKWGLYEIARYCDVMVSDGRGGVEPRFTCNCVIQSAADAYKVLQDIASVFRGISYWGPGAVVASADMPSDPVYVYTAANVIDGAFRYVGSERKTRYTVALVSYNDPSNQYKQAVEYVPDDDGIARYGVIKTQVTAFGCTSQAQAHRLGRWLLLTSRYESGTVSFKVGMDGVLVGPGQVIAIADPRKAGRRIGGRIRAVAGNVVTLDKAPTVAPGDRFTAILPSGVAQYRAVKSVNGDVLTLVDRFDADPVPGAVWMLENAEVAAQLYRVVSVQEGDDDGRIEYTITATMHEPGKYAAIDDGAQIQQRPVTVVPPSVQAPPANVRITTYSAVDQGISKTTMVIAWDAADNAVTYLPEWRKDNGEWVSVPRTGGLQVEVPGIYQGRYVARVRTQNVMNVTSLPAISAETQLNGKTSLPPAVVSLKAAGVVYGINLDWAFPGDGTAGDTQRTELWYSRTPNRADAIKLSDYAFPQASTSMQGLAVGQVFYFWARLVDTTGNIGPWFPANGSGVQGQPSTNQSEYEKYFAGQISHSALGEDLKKPIDAIPGIQQGVTDNATAIAKEVKDRTDAIAKEAKDRADAVADEARQRGAAVTAEQQARQTADDSLGKRIDTVSAGVGDAAAAVKQEATARTTADTALGQRIDTVVAQVGDASSAIQQEQAARIDADGALGKRVDAVSADVGKNSAAIQAEATARANADGALSTRIDAVVASSKDNASAISSEATARANADGALSSRIDAVTAASDSNKAAITAEQTARADGDAANAQSITGLRAQVGNTLMLRVTAPGGSVNPPESSAGLFNAVSGAQIAGSGRSWMVATVTANNVVSLLGRWDVFGSPANAAAMANALGGLTSAVSVIVWTFDEPRTNLAGVLQAALVNCGASNAVLSSIKYRGAYVLIGVPGSGEGAGVEVRSGAVDSDPTSRISYTFSMLNGRMLSASNSQAAALAQAAVAGEANARADADSALANQISQVSAQLNVPMAGDSGQAAGSTQVMAGVYSEQSARAEADMALGQRLDTVSAQMQIGQASLLADIRTESKARVDAISAQAEQITTIRAQANENAAAVQTVAQSYADLNGRVSASYQIKTQITSDGRTYIAGIGIGINNDSGIVESQVLVSAQRFAVVDPNNGGASIVPFVVQGGQVFLRQALIGAGWITNAMIGSYIQSDNYVAGKQGWRLDKSGWFEINSTDGLGNRTVIDSNGGRVYDANGVMRVRWGVWRV